MSTKIALIFIHVGVASNFLAQSQRRPGVDRAPPKLLLIFFSWCAALPASSTRSIVIADKVASNDGDALTEVTIHFLSFKATKQ